MTEYTLRRRLNGKQLVLIATMGAALTSKGNAKASAVIDNPVARHQIVKTREGSVVLTAQDIQRALYGYLGTHPLVRTAKYARLELLKLKASWAYANLKNRLLLAVGR